MTKIDLTGRTALVIGGTGGLGHAIARRFRADGATVHVTGTRSRAEEYDGTDLSGLSYHSLDVGNADAVKALAREFPALDLLVCAQGQTAFGGTEYEDETFTRVLDTNLGSIMRLAGALHDALAQRNGAIILLNSIAHHKATLGLPAYSASKAGLESLTRSLAEAWGPDGIRVNGIAPGFVETKMTAAAMSDEARRSAYLKTVPLGRFSTPDDVAHVALFLASELSSYMTGTTLTVDGGKLLR